MVAPSQSERSYIWAYPALHPPHRRAWGSAAVSFLGHPPPGAQTGRPQQVVPDPPLRHGRGRSSPGPQQAESGDTRLPPPPRRAQGGPTGLNTGCHGSPRSGKPRPARRTAVNDGRLFSKQAAALGILFKRLQQASSQSSQPASKYGRQPLK
ncbi:hypothetical protein NDU88_003928 [Pleurodeles waltl]|uniref:Uncharacterized protein n=1 Tax=Pleurodeles waltl TaxID=8319 RepID=A0AAV7SHF1_PLEWA|nr:hypothetical protein NDU88_003928 [Pleurodeles waltl]